MNRLHVLGKNWLRVFYSANVVVKYINTFAKMCELERASVVELS